MNVVLTILTGFHVAHTGSESDECQAESPVPVPRGSARGFRGRIQAPALSDDDDAPLALGGAAAPPVPPAPFYPAEGAGQPVGGPLSGSTPGPTGGTGSDSLPTHTPAPIGASTPGLGTSVDIPFQPLDLSQVNSILGTGGQPHSSVPSTQPFPQLPLLGAPTPQSNGSTVVQVLQHLLPLTQGLPDQMRTECIKVRLT